MESDRGGYQHYFTVDSEETYYSILPTTTAFARNAIFSGEMPLEMSRNHKDIWVGDENDEGKNNHEAEFLARNLEEEWIRYKDLLS